MSNVEKTERYKNASPFFRKLWSEGIFINVDGFMNHYEGFFMDFKDEDYVPFEDRYQFLFPVLNGTKYATSNALTLEEVKFFGELSQIPEPEENAYEQKIKHVLRILSKDIFKEHSLFLMKEHCRLFSPYNKKVKELLEKLECLED